MMPRELGFKLIPEFDKYIQRPASSAGHDHGPRIFTSVNGFPFFDSPVLKDPRALRDYVVFVGVPLISIDAGNANQKDGVSICVAGSTTITNTGPLRINTGQLVMWDIPKALPSISQELTKVNSVPRNKALFMTVPVDVDATDDGGVLGLDVDDALQAITADTGGEAKRARRNLTDVDVVREAYKRCEGKTGEAFDSAMQDMLKSFFLLLQQQHRRVIGIALSSAEPGESFDILFRGGGAF
jgi:hypothetical protein